LKSLQKIFSANAVILIVLFLTEITFSQSRVALLYSGYTESKNLDSKKNVFEEITNWELFLMESKIPYKVIYDDDLESGIEDNFDILILPSVEFISTIEFEELKNFIQSGKSIISVGSKLYQNDGVNQNLHNLENLFEINNLQFIASPKQNYQHTITANRINKFDHQEAGLIQISNKNNLMYCNSTNAGKEVYGYLLDDKIEEQKTSIVYGKKSNSRFLWTGFRLNDVVGGKEDVEKFHKVVLSTIYWMRNEPDVYLSMNYNGDKSSALLILENNNALQAELIDVVYQKGFNPHLVVQPETTLQPFIIEKFKTDKLILDLTNLVESNTNLDKLSIIVSSFEKANDLELRSVFINDYLLNQDYLNLFNSIGIKNILVNSNYSGIPVNNSFNMMILPISKKEPIDYGNIVYPIYYSPKFNCKKNSEDSLLLELNGIEKNKYAFASIDNFRDWWNSKENITVKNVTLFEERIEFSISNDNAIEVKNIPVNIKLSVGVKGNQISVSPANIIIEQVSNTSPDEVSIKLDNLFPKSNKKITIKFYQD
jgi:hypothetical protein